MSDDQVWAPTVGVVSPDPVPRAPVGRALTCAAVDSFGRTFKGAICPVHGGSRCHVEVEREPARLHPADVEAIALRVAELLRGRP